MRRELTHALQAFGGVRDFYHRWVRNLDRVHVQPLCTIRSATCIRTLASVSPFSAQCRSVSPLPGAPSFLS
jgi:hypothetical protein